MSETQLTQAEKKAEYQRLLGKVFESQAKVLELYVDRYTEVMDDGEVGVSDAVHEACDRLAEAAEMLTDLALLSDVGIV